MSFLNFNKSPVAYGAIMYNGSTGGTEACYPFFTSQSNLASLTSISSSGTGTISIGDIDDYWTVMPGYKLIVYADGSHGGAILLTGDNTNGVAPTNYVSSSRNQASSLKLFFNGTEIAQPS
jgi:hypothetical protein